MIDEHHPMQIGLFPMDIKCQQQHQHQHQPHHQQHQQQQQQQHVSGTGAGHTGPIAMGHNQLMLHGNERMLTTPTTAATNTTSCQPTASKTAAGAGVGVGGAGAGASTGASSHNDKMASASRNVNGSCINHSNTNSSSSSNNSSSMVNAQQQQQQQQQQQTLTMTMTRTGEGVGVGSGPGPGPPMQLNSHRVTLGECSLNELDGFPSSAVAPPPPSAPTHTPQAPQMLQQHNLMGIGGMGDTMALSMSNHCAYCCQPICDRYIMRVVDSSFHEGCLKCTACAQHLVHSCYARDGKLYCRLDYERLYLRNRCLGCGHKIAGDELVMRSQENIFHLKCFACVVCGALLKKGEQYVVKQGQLFCRFDYEKEVEMLQGYDFYGDDLFPPKMDGRRGPKRPRTILNTQQRRAFKASFEVSPKPCRKVRENLAKDTGLSLRIVQVWFQNQRAKVKKIQKKAKQEPPAKSVSDTHSQDSQESQDSSLTTKIKDEAQSDSESQQESPFSATSDGLTRLRCNIKDEQEQGTLSCMETNKENCNKNSEPILNTILGLSYATFQQLMGPFTQTPMINPIDRLYSMQSSYFRPEELGAYGECGGKESMDH
ncbi:LIM homeobox transcription factor 1-beta isoform X2 [Drosophila grimshawi]|uniref:LIM homeobox transcription factor 1-beta isoform X2 n=1 Tax=Drosophila grimshawi TaxID=7222 RepID=UPI000C8701FF|nr:LIM homeobox transcription factor 1-beta isoform X2 [Drosophila grimshawi]